MYNLKIDNVKFVSDSEIDITLETTKNNTKRTYKIISESFDYVKLVQEYDALATAVEARTEERSFFYTYRQGVCVKSRMGRNRYGEIFKEVHWALCTPDCSFHLCHQRRN